MSAEWHISEGGLQRGPLAEADLRSMIAAGQVRGQTMVWREGMEDWKSVSALPELCAGHPWLAAQAAGQVNPTNGLAVTSMVCGIVGLMLVLFCGVISGIAALPAVIFGHMALRAINEAQIPLGGRGMAIAGLVTGYLGLLAQLAAIGFFVFVFLSASNGVGP